MALDCTLVDIDSVIIHQFKVPTFTRCFLAQNLNFQRTKAPLGSTIHTEHHQFYWVKALWVNRQKYFLTESNSWIFLIIGRGRWRKTWALLKIILWKAPPYWGLKGQTCPWCGLWQQSQCCHYFQWRTLYLGLRGVRPFRPWRQRHPTQAQTGKVRIFWEGHKIWKKSST